MIGSPIEVDPEVAALHEDATVIDLHNDVLTKLSHVSYRFERRHRPAMFWNPARLDLDIPRIRAGGIDALGCLMFAGFRVAASRRFWRQLDEARRLVSRHAVDLALVDSPVALRAARAAGKVSLFLGVEGSYVVEKDIDANVARLVSAGVRFLGPLWERDSGAGSSCRARIDNGLTELGRRLVGACNQHDISLDVAHASRKTFWDIAAVSEKPVFSSHSGADGVHGHPRNLDDAQIREIARRGGIVGVIFVSPYLGSTFCAVPRIADHIEHVARVGGEDTVALGSDFDGFMPLARGMRDAADLPRLTQVLWDRGWREPTLRKLLGENALRFFDQTWRPRPVVSSAS
jgi:membrane dipeptidase